jgi:hypothetical protein
MVLTILGRRWFDRTGGNTYHTTVAYADGELVGKSPMTYGYGDQWLVTGAEILADAGKLPDYTGEPLWQYVDTHPDVTLVKSVTDVARKGDL